MPGVALLGIVVLVVVVAQGEVAFVGGCVLLVLWLGG